MFDSADPPVSRQGDILESMPRNSESPIQLDDLIDDKLYLFSAYYQGGDFPDNRFWNRNVMRDPRVRLKIGNQLFERTLSHVTDETEREAVHQTFVEKYTEWHTPGLENVHMFLVLP